jgi:hypothetical protein
MHTNIDIDKKLLDEAMVLGQLKTKKATVNEALAGYVRHLKQQRVIELFGKIDFDPSYDYKASRRAR